MATITSLHRQQISTLADLERFIEAARSAIEDDCVARAGNRVGQPMDEEIYVAAPTTTLFMDVVAEQLSDGSFVYDVQVSEAPRNAPTEHTMPVKRMRVGG